MDKRLREALEACRPDSNDLLASELSDVAGADLASAVEQDAEARLAHDRIVHWDRLIATAMEEVAVPPGLGERLLARLAEAERNGGGLLAEVVSQAQGAAERTGDHVVNAALGSEAEQRPERGWSSFWQRRYWTGTTLLAIAASLFVVAIGYWWQWGSDQPLDQLAIRWQAELSEQAWQPAETAPHGFPLPPGVRVPPSRWQWIGRLTPTPVVAYELLQGQSKAMLYAAKLTRPGIRTAPPLNPQTGSSGQAIGYWQSGDVLYVLVVPDARNYRGFLRSTPAPLAIHQPADQGPWVPLARFSVTARKIA